MSKKPIRISLTEAPPVTLNAELWPIVARASWCDDPRIPVQANREAFVRVRRHEDGRAVVYGVYASRFQGERDVAAGYVLAAGGDLVQAIRDVAEEIGQDDLARECIQDLPSVDLDAAVPA